MKRRLFTIVTLLFAMIGTLILAAACGPEEQEKEPPVAGEETGPYYCDVAGKEYDLTLTELCEYTLVMDGETITGTYTPNGEDLVFADGEALFLGTYFNDVIELTYGNEKYTFLRKIEYTITYQSNGGSAVSSATVYNGRKAQKPANPTKAGQVFVGWYTDTAFKSAYSFNQPVTSDFTLYARFVAPIEPEYTVSFDLNGAPGSLPAVTTVGHQAFGLPTPEWEGHTFVGWWVSHYESAEKLTYRYDEQVLGGNTTFFAVWQDAGKLALSVGEEEITWSSAGANAFYTLIITNTSATEDQEVVHERTDKTSYAFDFAEADGGDYKVSIVVNNQTTERWFRNKALDPVTVFTVTGRVLQFNAVENATSYELTVDCGGADHDGPIPISAEQRSYNFSECELKEDGTISFTVTAKADGYLASVSEPFVFSPVLGAVSGISVDAASEQLQWTAVENATSYDVVIKQGDEVVKSDNTEGTSYSVKHLNKGTYTVTVAPKARGWNSPAPTQYTYNKNTLATPSNVHADTVANKIVWDNVNGAAQYEVTVGTEKRTVNTNEIVFDESFLKGTTTEYSVTVRALGATAAENSLVSDAITVSYGKLSGELRYKDGALSWNATFGITEYTLSISYGGGAATEETVENASTYELAFEKAGDYTFTLRPTTTDDPTQTLTLTVKIHEVKFIAAGYGAVPSLYVATGDTLALPEGLTIFGYSLGGWYTTNDEQGELYNDSTYNEERGITLYAHWAPNSYTIKLNVGMFGESLEETEISAKYGAEVRLPVPEASDPSKSFAGWYDSSAGGAKYTDYSGVIESFKKGMNVTLYAHWVDVLSFTVRSDGKYSVSKSPDIELTGVTQIKIPATYKGQDVVEVADFTNCTLLEVIEIPDSIRNIVIGTTESAFTGCEKLREIKIYTTDFNGDKYYSDDNGVLIYNNPASHLKELKFYPVARTQTSYDVPDGIQVIPSGVFYEIKPLVSISFPASVTLIEAQAVGGKYDFSNSIQTITFRGSGDKPLTMQENAFYQVAALASLTLPANMQDFDFHTSFYSEDGFSKLAKVDIVGSGTYSAKDNSIFKNVGGTDGYELVFYDLNAKTFTLPTDIVVTKIGKNAVQGNTSITEITIPQGITEIGERAFYGTSAVKTITFAGTEASEPLTIRPYAFYGAGKTSGYRVSYKLTELTLPANLVFVGAHAFGDTGVTTVTVNSTAEAELQIADGAFSTDAATSTSTVTTLNIGPDVKNVNFMAAFGSQLNKVKLDEGNTYYEMDEAETILYTKGQTEIVWIKDISGTFTIPDTVTRISAGNFKDRKNLTKIVIPASVASIGNEAFSGCTKLAEVEFTQPKEGETRTLTIGNRAFYGCTSLKSIDLPEGTTTLGAELFKGCSGLTKVVLPTTLQSIITAMDADSYGDPTGACFGMFDDAGTSSGAKISSLTMHDGTPKNYKVENNALYLMKTDAKGNAYASELLYFAPYANVEEVVIPATVEKIWRHAFCFSSSSSSVHIKSVKFAQDALEKKFVAQEGGDPVEADRRLTIERQAFYNATTITSIKLPRGTVSIGEEAFYNAGITSFAVPNTVESIYPAAFYGCTQMTSLTFETGGTAPLRFEDTLFDPDDYYSGLFGSSSSQGKVSTVELPERTTYIGDGAFIHAPITGIVIPASVTYIGVEAFDQAKVQTVTFAPNSTVSYIGEDAFNECAITEITIPKSVTYIGIRAFSRSTQLRSVTFEDGSLLEWLGEASDSAIKGVFEGCTSLSKVDFGKGSHLRYLGPDTFEGCTALKNIELPLSLYEIADGAFNGNVDSNGRKVSGIEKVTFEQNGEQKGQLHRIGDAFSETPLTSFTFPESENEIIIPENMFKGCEDLAEVNISSTVYDLKDVLLGCDALTTVTVNEANPYYQAEGAFLLNKLSKDIILVFGSLTGEYRVPEGAVQIGAGAFANTDVESVILPSSITRILESAFSGCDQLTSVTFEAGSVLEVIGANAFSGCSALSALDLSGTRLTELPEGVFTGCLSLETLKVPATLTAFNSAMAGTKISSMDLSQTQITELPVAVFADCAELASIFVPTTLKTIGANAFSGCTKLASFDFSGIESIGTGAFQNTGLTKVTLTDKVEWAAFDRDGGYKNQGVFANSKALKEVVFAASLPENPGFSSNMFENCTALDTITFEKDTKVGYFGESMFKGCTALQTVTIPASFTVLSSNFNNATASSTFANCTGLTTVDLSASPSTTLPSNMFSGCNNISTFKLPTALKEIPSGFFSGNTALESIEIPETVETIAYEAFKNCTALTSIDLSKTAVTKIDYSVFAGCAALGEVTFPEELTSIGHDAFNGCAALESVSLPETVTSIGYLAFCDCSTLSAITMPGVQTIDYGAFSRCVALKNVELPSTLKAINGYSGSSYNEPAESGAFQGCTSLQTVTMAAGASTVTIGKKTFAGCSELITVTLPVITAIGESTFEGCSKMITINLPEGMLTIGKNAFKDCTNLMSINLPSSITSIGASAFENCSKLGNVTLPAGLKESGRYDGHLGASAFKNCTALTKADLSNCGLWIIPANAFEGCASLTSVTLPETVTDLKASCFAGSGLTSIVIPEKVTVIEDYVFENCADLASVTFNTPAAYDSAYSSTTGDYLFRNCTSLTTVKFADNTTFTEIGKGWFSGCEKLETITLPTSVTKLADEAFLGCKKLPATLNVEKVTSFGPRTFEGCDAIFNSENNWKTGVYYLGQLLLKYDDDKIKENNGKVEIKEGTVGLPDGFFKDSLQMTEITIPASVTTLGVGLFEGCTSLQTVNFAETCKIAAFPENLFLNCEALISLTIPASVTSIGKHAFMGSFITTLNIPETVGTLADEAIKGAKKLTTVDIKSTAASGLKAIAANAFEDCENLTTVTLSETVTTIGANAFKNCASLATFAFDKITKINENAFDGCGFTTLDIPESLPATGALGNGAFANNTKLTKVDFTKAKVTTISQMLFMGCTNLATVEFGKVDYISKSGFQGCTSLASIKLPAISSYGLGESAFEGCTSLATVDMTAATKVTSIGTSVFKNTGISSLTFLSANVTSIGQSAFDGCKFNGELTIPEQITSIKANAFANCTDITKVVMPKKLQDVESYYESTYALGANMFAGCTKLDEIDFSKTTGTLNISANAFKDVASLTKVTFPAEGLTLTKIGASAFEGCTSLAAFSFNEGLTSIGNSAFKGTALESVELPASLADYSSSSYSGTTGLGQGVFEECASLGSVDFTKATQVTILADRLFKGCTSLTEVKLPTNLKAINASAFEGCESLADITLSDDVNMMGANAFAGTALKAIKLPAALTDFKAASYGSAASGMGNGVFKDCLQLASADFSAATLLTAIPAETFSGCTSLATVTLADDDAATQDPTFTSIGASAFFGCKELKNFVIPATVTSIGANAFEGSGMSGKLELSANVATLGAGAFKDTAITAADLSAATVTAIPEDAFNGCTALASVVLPDAITSIGANAFAKTVFTEIAIPAGVKTIGAGAFEASGLTSVNLSACTGLTAIADGTFKGSAALASVTLPTSVTSIGASAFEGCTALETINLTNVTNIGTDAFKGTKLLGGTEGWEGPVFYIGTVAVAVDNEKIPEGGAVTFKAGTTALAEGLFNGCTKLVSVDLSSFELTAISANFFKGCSSLTTVVLPATITSIGENAFSGCTNLATLTLPKNLTALGAGAFEGTKIAAFDFSESTFTAIPENAFKDCASLASIKLPTRISSIGAHAFAGCTSLTEFTFSASLTSIGEGAFQGSGLTAVDLSPCSSLSSAQYGIGASAFADCKNLVSVKLYSNIRFFGDRCFANTGIKEIFFPTYSNQKTFGKGVFEGTTGLEIRFADNESWLRSSGIAHFDDFIDGLPEGTTVLYGQSA